MSLFEELKRRNVFRVGLAYLVGSWLLLQIIDVVGPILRLPEQIARYVLFLLLVGFIPALILAWAFELTPDGVKLESEVDRSKSITPHTGRKLDRAIMIILALAVGFLLFDKLALQSHPEPNGPASTQSDLSEKGSEPFSYGEKRALTPFRNVLIPSKETPKSVAVLPFATMSNGPDDDYFADGLTEEIINALAQLPELLVTARTSAFHFKNQNLPVEEIAGQLGVDHIVEGSVRRAGEQLRITAQLIRADDGFHIWSETYDQRTEDTFAVQENIAEQIATALNVMLDDQQRAQMRRVGIRNVEAYTNYQKGQEYSERAHGEGELISLLRQGNQYFERAIELAPDFFPAHVSHSDLFTHILISNANGELDGNIMPEDIENAPAALKLDLENAVRSAANIESRLAAEFDLALTLGEWRGLSSLSERSLQQPGCNSANWSQLASSAFGRAQLARDAFSQLAVCDPMLYRPWAQLIRAHLWLGEPQSAIESVDSRLLDIDHQWIISAYVTALAAVGRGEEAEQVISGSLRKESERLFSNTILAAQLGNEETAAELQKKYLAQYGPNDFYALMMEAVRGNRNEANRLASLIDRRSFGYMTLLQVIYHCTCGAPFDLEATPVFASMLAESGLPWPPAKPIDFPLKDW
jgi:TolB-like protein